MHMNSMLLHTEFYLENDKLSEEKKKKKRIKKQPLVALLSRGVYICLTKILIKYYLITYIHLYTHTHTLELLR